MRNQIIKYIILSDYDSERLDHSHQIAITTFAVIPSAPRLSPSHLAHTLVIHVIEQIVILFLNQPSFIASVFCLTEQAMAVI